MDSMRPLGDLDKTLHVKMCENRIRVDIGSSLGYLLGTVVEVSSRFIHYCSGNV